MDRLPLRARLAQVGEALREPEAFALRWHREGTPYDARVFLALGLTAIAGTTAYGLIMGLAGGPQEMMSAGLRCTAAAGLAWGLPLPALYILNSVSGSRLRASTTFLAALVTTSWGGLAMLAGLPLAWFFTVALPFSQVMLAVHLIVFAAVGVAMIDVFSRVMATLEPGRGRRPAWWLVLVGAIGVELFHAFGLFRPFLSV
jgi:Sec-independent protein secretion pathway component TatC